MGSHWLLTAGRRELLWGKNFLPDPLMLVFDDDDRRIDRTRYAALQARWSTDDGAETSNEELHHLYTYQAKAEDLVARLTLQGFGPTAVVEHAERYLDDEMGSEDSFLWGDIDKEYRTGKRLLQAMLTWESRNGRIMARGESRHDRSMSWAWDELLEAFDDPRFKLALGLTRTRRSTTVTLDLTDLLLGGWLEENEIPHRTARTRVANDVTANGRVIVITEGRTDAEFLTRALALARPELTDAFSFLDFEGTSAPGGTDRVVSLTRGMAAAKVMNRVVAVLDNDTAGKAAFEQLKRSNLAVTITATRLPDVELGSSYPTLGPNGMSHVNINGRAITIEMMFGQTVLQDSANLTLSPVRWTGYNSAVGEYQGEVEAKKLIQARIRTALSAPSIDHLDEEAAEGCRRLASMLIDATAEATPALSSDFSPLLWIRERESDANVSIDN
ncbi:HEPN/Toprim-associated domain-containing protein [Isoptericola sp. 4D.3]|uniref:HEPN/Toprim-associated domain-containing protein n=1 Tax=Isoptericola peretonis TaxID=2918523 RepID=A0ABT0J6U8_9MICO|nr:HEPN/Toprim-associated domain-containing protein [Isoptericola sp. 4D.3]